MAWKIKIDTNDGLRQKFVDQTVPQADYLGLTIPDPDLKWNEEKGGYDFSEPDWTEFFDVIAGNGPCNKERLGARVKAWDDGAWFRDGLTGPCQESRGAPRHCERLLPNNHHRALAQPTARLGPFSGGENSCPANGPFGRSLSVASTA